MPPHPIPVIERMWSKTIVDPTTNCWLYQGRLEKGYGKIGYLKWSNMNVHRISANLFLKLDINDKKQFACHRDDICSNRNCWNPDHLYIGSSITNYRDMRKRGTFKTPFVRGHNFSTRSKRGTPTCS